MMPHVHRPLRVPAARIATAIRRQDAEPGTELLTHLLRARPTPQALQDFANRAPHRWVHLIAIFARLAGYEMPRQRGLRRSPRLGDAAPRAMSLNLFCALQGGR